MSENTIVQLIDRIVLTVAELPDRTSPEEWPDAMIVTDHELRTILTDALVTAGRACCGCGEALTACVSCAAADRQDRDEETFAREALSLSKPQEVATMRMALETIRDMDFSVGSTAMASKALSMVVAPPVGDQTGKP